MARRILRPPIYGLLAEFESPAALISATMQVRGAGYRHMDAFSPFPLEGLAAALGFHRSRVPLITLCGGVAGGVGGYAMQYWIAAVSYPLNIGGRPYNSWPAFIPVTFELTILGAALAAVLGMLALNGLPRPYHPVFHIPSFALASRDRFFLCVESRDPQFDMTQTRVLLESLKPRAVSNVPY
jgi:hypothetical protein